MTCSLLVLGFLLGMKHAVEADHVAAVATLASRARHWREPLALAGLWGVGHATALTGFGVALLALGITLPAPVATTLEGMVGLVLIALGLDALRRLRTGRVHFHVHQHAQGPPHFHAHAHAGDTTAHDPFHHHHRHGLARRALAVGTLHGLAGSAALVLLAAQAAPSSWQRLAYLAVFGVGTVLGMMTLSLAIAVPFRLTAHRLGRVQPLLEGGLGTATIALGAWIAFATLLAR